MPPSRPVPPTDSQAGAPSRRTLLAAAAAFGLVPEVGRAQNLAPTAPAQAEPAALPATPGTALNRGSTRASGTTSRASLRIV